MRSNVLLEHAGRAARSSASEDSSGFDRNMPRWKPQPDRKDAPRRRHAMKRWLIAVISIVGLVATFAGGSSAAPAQHRLPAATDALVSVGSPQNNHPQNAANEPSLAVDPVHPDVLAAGSNDLVDMQPCS